jgi:hypothetical protein
MPGRDSLDKPIAEAITLLLLLPRHPLGTGVWSGRGRHPCDTIDVAGRATDYLTAFLSAAPA